MKKEELKEIKKMIYLESKISKIQAENPEFENFSVDEKIDLIYDKLSIDENQQYGEDDLHYFCRACWIPFEQLNEDLNKYDGSSPKLDEIEFINVLEKKYHVPTFLIKRRIKDIREINKVMKKDKKQKFDVLAVPYRREFIVAPEKAEEFKNQKPNIVKQEEMRIMVEKFEKNNLVGEGPIKKIGQKKQS